ncbi:unnamed protein product [Calypogeia fissa]
MRRYGRNKGVDQDTSYIESKEAVGTTLSGKSSKLGCGSGQPIALSVTRTPNRGVSNIIESSRYNYQVRDENGTNIGIDRGLTIQQQSSRNRLFGQYHHESASERGQLRRSTVARLAQHHKLDQVRPRYANAEELESYAIVESQDVTKDIYQCMRIVEETSGVAATMMETLHLQGRQIPRSHYKNSDVMEKLQEGEKVLGSFGGLFTKRWKPKKGNRIKGPRVEPGDPYKKKTLKESKASAALLNDDAPEAINHLSQRNPTRYAGLSGPHLQLEMEREHQDQALSNLGDMIDKLRDMSFEMGSEVEKQTAALGDMADDVDIVGDRLRQAHHRTRYHASW